MSKQTIIIVAATAFFVLAILVVKNLNSNNNVIGTNQGVQQSQPADPMHAGGQSIESALFDSLVGKSAPDFNLTSYDGKSYSLNSLKGKNVVLFFSEGVMCYPACWNQIAAFGTDSRFNNGDTIVVTIVNDNKSEWQNAMQQMPNLAKTTILFDTSKTVSQAYGVLNLPSSMHRGQFPGHSYVVIDKNGIVRYVFDDPNMAIRNDNLITQINKL